MCLAFQHDFAVAGVVAQSLRNIPTQQHGGVLAGAASHENQFELVLVAGLFRGVDGFDHGGVGNDLGAQVADGEVGAGVVVLGVVVCEAWVGGCGAVARQCGH